MLALNTMAFTMTREFQEIESNNYGKQLLDTIALQMDSETPLSEIMDLLNKLSSQLTSEQEAADAKNKTEEKHCVDTVKQLTERIAKDVKTIERAKNELAVLNSQLKKNQKFHATKITEIASNIADTSSLVRQRAKDRQEYDGYVSEHNAVRSAIADALKVVNELVGSVAGVGGIKVHKTSKGITKEENAALSMLERLIQIGKNNPILSFATLAATADQDTVKMLIGKLEDMDASFKASLDKATAAENQAVADFNTLKTEYEKALEDLRTAKANLEATIADLKSQIAEQERIKKEAEDDKRVAEKELDDTRKDCALKRKKYAEDSAQRASELNIVAKVKTIFTTKLASMKKYLKERVEKNIK